MPTNVFPKIRFFDTLFSSILHEGLRKETSSEPATFAYEIFSKIGDRVIIIGNEYCISTVIVAKQVGPKGS